jgi:hypothetical protein
MRGGRWGLGGELSDTMSRMRSKQFRKFTIFGHITERGTQLMEDYKAQLHEDITQLQAATKRGELQREVRLGKIRQLTEDYFDKNGEWPDAVSLERLADLVLYEEITDTDRMKARNNEYPFFSETQLARRQEGLHARGGTSGEVPLSAADSVGTDGKSYGIPTRRKRNSRENRFVDKEAKIRNKERKHQYTEFTKVQPVIKRTIDGLEK